MVLFRPTSEMMEFGTVLFQAGTIQVVVFRLTSEMMKFGTVPFQASTI